MDKGMVLMGEPRTLGGGHPNQGDLTLCLVGVVGDQLVILPKW